VVRLFSLQDVFLLRRLQSQGVGFDLRRSLLDAPSPVSSALLDYFTRHRLGAITCIHQDTIDGEDLSGFAQVWPRADKHEWELGYVAPAPTSHGDGAVWRQLLTHLVVLGAERGILRIYARSCEDPEIEEILRQAGFIQIAREEVFARAQEPAPWPQPPGLRPVNPQDHWALGRLYRQAVPQLVRQAEALPPQRIGAPHATLPARGSVDGFVWMDEGKILAYLGLCTSPNGCWLEVVALPECRAETLPYIKYVLTLTRCSAHAPVYCPVPDFGAGLGWVLRALHFEPYARQVLLVAHTAARVPVRRPVRAVGLERGANVRTPVGHVRPGDTVNRS